LKNWSSISKRKEEKEFIVAGAEDVEAMKAAKSINYYAKLRNAHIIVGAKASVLIPSRADLSDVKFNSIALAIASKV